MYSGKKLCISRFKGLGNRHDFFGAVNFFILEPLKPMHQKAPNQRVLFTLNKTTSKSLWAKWTKSAKSAKWTKWVKWAKWAKWAQWAQWPKWAKLFRGYLFQYTA